MLDAGRVVERGTPADLLAADGAYRRLVEDHDRGAHEVETPGMSDMRRLLQLVLPHWPWLAAGALFGVIAIGSNIALMGLSAYLISKAAIASGVAELALAVTGVRVLAISRAAFRYLERYTTHRAMFRILATVRVWFYRGHRAAGAGSPGAASAAATC